MMCKRLVSALPAVAFVAACASLPPTPAGRGATSPAVARIGGPALLPATSPLPSEFGPRLLVRHADMGVEVDKTSVTDVITVEKELATVQGELDSLESRLTQARGQVAMARLAVTLQPRHVLRPLGLAFAGIGWVVQKLFFIR